MKTPHLLGLTILAAAMLHGQPTTGAQYWSTAAPDCSQLGESTPATITNASGATVGYSCYVSGTFIWLAAGGTWGSSIRVAAPASGAIGVDYSFYDNGGKNLNLDAAVGTSTVSGNDVNFALNKNQPSEVRLLGAPSEAPNYGTTQTGIVGLLLILSVLLPNIAGELQDRRRRRNAARASPGASPPTSEVPGAAPAR